jgi:hypothetical protein
MDPDTYVVLRMPVVFPVQRTLFLDAGPEKILQYVYKLQSPCLPVPPVSVMLKLPRTAITLRHISMVPGSTAMEQVSTITILPLQSGQQFDKKQ